MESTQADDGPRKGPRRGRLARPPQENNPAEMERRGYAFLRQQSSG
jgi:hypothetical protein